MSISKEKLLTLKIAAISLSFFLVERTKASAETATTAAAAMLLLARQPALSVNGNVAALVAEEMVDQAAALGIPLEVDLFHRSEERVRKIADLLRTKGAKEVLGEKPDASVPGLDHARALATRGGIYDADVVLIPLEDGDRCEALVAIEKEGHSYRPQSPLPDSQKGHGEHCGQLPEGGAKHSGTGPDAVEAATGRSGEDSARARQ
jgi:hypothetical protein